MFSPFDEEASVVRGLIYTPSAAPSGQYGEKVVQVLYEQFRQVGHFQQKEVGCGF